MNFKGREIEVPSSEEVVNKIDTIRKSRKENNKSMMASVKVKERERGKSLWVEWKEQ